MSHASGKKEGIPEFAGSSSVASTKKGKSSKGSEWIGKNNVQQNKPDRIFGMLARLSLHMNKVKYNSFFWGSYIFDIYPFEQDLRSGYVIGHYG
jgi:hypothetical protein